jgi:hypothetical protein
MNTDRHETLFSIRYAVRALERQGALWGRFGLVLKFCSVLSGAAAVTTALSAGSAWAAAAAGLLFAALQALEVVVDPAGKSAAALAQRRDYARLMARQSGYSDGDLEAEYQALVADDSIATPMVLRRAAYNDVVHELGRDPQALYPDQGWLARLSA